MTSSTPARKVRPSGATASAGDLEPPARVRADRPLQPRASCSTRRRSRATSRSATCSSAPPRTTRGSCCPEGEVTTAVDQPGTTRRPGESLYLRLVQKPLGGVELARWRRGPTASASAHPAVSHASGSSRGSSTRASRPRSCCAAPCRAARPRPRRSSTRRARGRPALRLPRPRRPRSDGWICLHYLFFYFMNDYRSTFYGVNDHEADWEQVFIYLEDAPDGPRPVWIAAAAHDYTGDELRRRWDDPTLETRRRTSSSTPAPARTPRTSSAASTSPRCPSPPCEGLGSFLDVLREFWRDTPPPARPGRPAGGALERAQRPVRRLRARRRRRRRARRRRPTWTPVLIDDDVDWVDGYRGLFGLDTHDRFAGRARARRAQVHALRARSASPGTTRSGSPAWTSPRRLARRRRSSASASRSWRRRRPRSMAEVDRPGSRSCPASSWRSEPSRSPGRRRVLHADRARGPRARGGRPRRPAGATGEHRGHDRGPPGRARGARGRRARGPARPPEASPSAGPARGDPLQRRRRGLVRGQRRACCCWRSPSSSGCELVTWVGALLVGGRRLHPHRGGAAPAADHRAAAGRPRARDHHRGHPRVRLPPRAHHGRRRRAGDHRRRRERPRGQRALAQPARSRGTVRQGRGRRARRAARARTGCPSRRGRHRPGAAPAGRPRPR